MALVIGASEDAGRNRQDEDFDRRLSALETALAALSGTQTPQATQQTIQQIIQRALLYVGDVGGTPVPTDTLLADPADGLITVLNGDAVELHRAAASGTPNAVGTTGNAGSSTEAANKDHTHALGIITTKGDILVFSTVPDRLAVGANNSHLVADSSAAKGVKWLGPTGTYTPTNVTTDRAFDANATTLDEVADVLGTLIADLQARGDIG